MSNALRSLVRTPEFGSLVGATFVFAFFAIAAGDAGFLSLQGLINIAEVSAQLGILAIGAAALMMAGEFDLSMGSMIGAAGIIVAVMTTELGYPLWAAVTVALGFAAVVGFANGYLVIKTKLPSFIVTLASLFVLRGLCVGVTRLVTGRTQISGVGDAVGEGPLASLYSGHAGHNIMVALAERGLVRTGFEGQPLVPGIPASVLWWLALALVVHFLVFRTRIGNWILATGGDVDSARRMGVPVDRVKIACFIATSLSAALLAIIQVLDTGSADTNRGIQKEFEAIIAVVIGGTLLTGGYGTILGACLGAFIFGTVEMGIFFTGIDTDWFKVFLGTMMLVAVLLNDAVRRAATGGAHH